MKILESKLSILERTLGIIKESISSVKYSSAYATKINAKMQMQKYIKNLRV
jgi:hypothetical protein